MLLESGAGHPHPPRVKDSHKGSNGHVLVVAGSRQYRGAATLAAMGSLKAGAGLVTVASIEPVLEAVAAQVPEAILLPLPEDAGALSEEAHVPLSTLIPVSYTHLDVYKRQVEGFAQGLEPNGDHDGVRSEDLRRLFMGELVVFDRHEGEFVEEVGPVRPYDVEQLIDAPSVAPREPFELWDQPVSQGSCHIVPVPISESILAGSERRCS